VGDEQWQGAGFGQAHMHEVDLLAVDLDGVLRKLVQLGFVLAPVVAGAPVGGQLLYPGPLAIPRLQRPVATSPAASDGAEAWTRTGMERLITE
jgi:hypothetical protein